MIELGLSLRNRICTVVGGGTVAERRIGLILSEECRIIVISPTVTDQIETWHKEGSLEWIKASYEVGSLPQSDFVFIATDLIEVNDKVMEEARAMKAFISRADDHRQSDIVLPASLHVGDLQLAIFTNRISPRVSRLIRMDLESRYGPLRDVLPKIKEWREELKDLLETPKEREAFWHTYMGEKEFERILCGEGRGVEEEIINAISSIRSKP